MGLVWILGPDHSVSATPLRVQALQWAIGTFVLDTWQYWWHRAFHVSQFLYKNVHSVHHRLLMPYALGALYNHIVESFMLDIFGSVIAYVILLLLLSLLL